MWPMTKTRSYRPLPPPPLAQFLRPRLTMTDLAEAAGVDPSYISRVASGQVPASRKVREAATRLLGLPEETLFGDRLDGEGSA